MITILLLLLLPLALSQGVSDEEEVLCFGSDMNAYQVGNTTVEGCKDCTCKSDGEWECEGEPCCLINTLSGVSKRVKNGEKFAGGCSKCKCRGGTCHVKDLCPKVKKCKYENWDEVVSYAKPGDLVDVWGQDEDGEECRKICRCKEKAGGSPEISCTADNGVEEPCVF